MILANKKLYGSQGSQAMGRYYAEILRFLADSLLLPLHVTDYNKVLTEFVKNLKDGYGEIMTGNNINLGA